MPRPLEILLVEDNEGDVEMTRRALKRSETPARLSVTNDGLDALNFLRKNEKYVEAPDPDIILLDINMPRMDGKRFLEHAKEDPQLKVIPVIMFTSSQSPADIRECYERHASCYVVKPFGANEFSDTINKVVGFWGNVGNLPGGH